MTPLVVSTARADDEPTPSDAPAETSPAPATPAPAATAPAPTETPPAPAPPAPAPVPAAAATAPAAAATDAAPAIDKEALLEARLADHAIVTGEIGVGLQLASNRHGGSLIATVDVTAFHPVWARLRGRGISGMLFVDTLAGYSVRHSRDVDVEAETVTETVGETSTAYIKQISVYSTKLVARHDLVIAGGLKHEWSYDDRDMDPDIEGSGFHSQIVMVGAQKHMATSEGSHDYIELYGLYNLETGGKGFQVVWHNSAAFLPSIWGRRMYGGMEFAWLPAAGGSEFYFGLVDIGISLEI
jgi:hypothetical protein